METNIEILAEFFRQLYEVASKDIKPVQTKNTLARKTLQTANLDWLVDCILKKLRRPDLKVELSLSSYLVRIIGANTQNEIYLVQAAHRDYWDIGEQDTSDRPITFIVASSFIGARVIYQDINLFGRLNGRERARVARVTCAVYNLQSMLESAAQMPSNENESPQKVDSEQFPNMPHEKHYCITTGQMRAYLDSIAPKTLQK